MMVTTQSKITSLSGIKKETCLEFVSQKSSSPCFNNNSAPITSQLQHLRNSKLWPTNLHTNNSDLCCQNSGTSTDYSSCSSACYCSSQSERGRSSSSCSESDTASHTHKRNNQLTNPELIGFSKSELINRSASSVLQSKRRYRIRFQEKEDTQSNLQRSLSTSFRGRPGTGRPLPINHNTTQTLSKNSHQPTSSNLKRIGPETVPHHIRPHIAQPGKKQKPTIITKHLATSCNNIVSSSNNWPRERSKSPTQSLKPKRAKSFRKLLQKSKSFIFSSSSSKNISCNSNDTWEVNKSPTERYKSKVEPNFIRGPSSSRGSKWLEGFKVKNDEKELIASPPEGHRSLTLCESCGGLSGQDLQDFCPTPRKYLYATLQPNQNSAKDHEGKGWIGMEGENIYFYGRYSKLPNEEYPNSQYQYNKPDQSKSKPSPSRSSTVALKKRNNKEQDQGHLKSSIDNYPYSSGQQSGRVVQQLVAGVNSFDQISTMDNNRCKQKVQCNNNETEKDEYRFNYECRIPRPKFVIPLTHSYGVKSAKSLINRQIIDIVDASGFTEISLSDNENEGEDTAYGSGSHSSSSKSSKFRSQHSSDEMLSEFEREQEQSIFNGSSRRLLSLKNSFWSITKSSPKVPSGRNQQQIVERLKSVPLFKKLGTSFLTNKLSQHVTEVNFDCGEYIIRQGSEGEGLFVLMSGTAKVTFTSNLNGEEHIYLKTLHPGDMFGEKSLQGEKVNMTNVMTSDESASCLLISEQGFEQLIAKNNGDLKNRLCDKSQKTSLNEYFEGIELEDLRLVSTLGIGGFGRVELVTLASDQSQSFALKQMKKCQIVATRQIEHIKSEKEILMETNCEFITKLYKTFKDSKYLYMLMECCLGGEVWTILRDRGHFNDNTTRFYAGCVLEALKYLHNRNIIYRDLKPENLLLDARGYLKLVDFGFAKRLEGNKTWTFCGTPEYCSPEVILNKGHNVTCDYYSLGILLYELLVGTPPFVGGDPMRTYKLILKGVDYIDFPETVGEKAYNLIRKLCRENPEERLGAQRGLSEIRRHRWFDGFDWHALRAKTLTPPIIPIVRGPHDCGNFDDYPPETGKPPEDDLHGWDWDF